MKSNRSLKPPIAPLAKAKKTAILAAVRQVGGDVALAADKLEIGKTTLYRKLKEYGRGRRAKRRKVRNQLG
jgi:transcriptional regulator of acetoin/glycerol metabolism